MFKLSKIRPAKVCNNFDVKNSISYVSSIVAPLRWKELPDGCVKFQTDVTLLFNQQRIVETLGADSLKSWLGSFDAAYRSSVDTSKLPDDAVLKFIKSRYIQSPSELLAWSAYLNDEADSIVQQYELDLQEQLSLHEQAKASPTAVDSSSSAASVSNSDLNSNLNS